MPRKVDDTVLDAALNEIINNADQMILCEGEPSGYSDATTQKGSGGSQLGNRSITATDFSGPTDGDTSGRKLTVGVQTGITIDVGGTMNHVALVDDDNSRLLHVTTLPGRTVNANDEVDTDPYDEEIEDPTSP